MIVVNDENIAGTEGFPKRIATKVEGGAKKFLRNLANDGLTPPTKNIRKRFFRKK